MYLSLSIQWV
uniref:Uncharacterized protein n=1 Tax=Arundo donax TaxID=35708 RepID=A0A0A9BIU7_ARUDO